MSVAHGGYPIPPDSDGGGIMKIPKKINEFIESVAQETDLSRKVAIIQERTDSSSLSNLGSKQFLFCHAVWHPVRMEGYWQVFVKVSSNHKKTEIRMEFKLPSKIIHTFVYEERIPESIDLKQFRNSPE